MATTTQAGRSATGGVEPGTGTRTTGSRVRRIAFRVVSWLTALLVLAMFSFGLLEIALMWLPASALEPFAAEGESVADLLTHRTHFNIVGIVSWAIVPALLVQLRRPERRTAPMLLAVGLVVAGTVVYGLSGTLTAWLTEEIILLVPVLLVAGLHPRARDLIRRPTLENTMAGLTALAAVPWTWFALTQAQLQWRDAAGDPHAAMEHWATAALLAAVIVLGGLLGASDHAGWRLPAGIAAFASIDYGIHSLVFAGAASAAPTVWALAAVGWGVAYGVAAVRRSRGGREPALIT